ncbi:MAG: M48 family metallopeptidase [Candidatus Peribacteraceae bacterium]|nr:M48 family metallopeptidase [Candidatus Peribacteraceae bacterium]
MSPLVRIERTRNRHSRAVLDRDMIVIRLARRLTSFEEQRHIESLVRRMTKMLQQDRGRVKVDPYFPIIDPSTSSGQAQLQEIEKLVHELNAATLRVSIRAVRLRPMMSQWGSCSHSGNITLNTALLKLPRHLLEYVIVHELAHRLVKNHSRAFWNVVESAFPNAKTARKELLGYRLQRR